MNVEFLEPAWTDLVEAVEYYNDQEEGLGFELSEEILTTIKRIIQYPEAWPLISKRTRRCRSKRFPYGIIYQIRGETLLIIAGRGGQVLFLALEGPCHPQSRLNHTGRPVP